MESRMVIKPIGTPEHKHQSAATRLELYHVNNNPEALYDEEPKDYFYPELNSNSEGETVIRVYITGLVVPDIDIHINSEGEITVEPYDPWPGKDKPRMTE